MALTVLAGYGGASMWTAPAAVGLPAAFGTTGAITGFKAQADIAAGADCR